MMIFSLPIPMIPQETLEQVAAANDIVDVIGSYVPLKRAGANFMALCPFHREKSPSFNVSPSRQSFKCFGCGAGGGVFKFITLFENIEFPAAVRRLAERAGIPIIEEQWGRPEDRGVGELRRRLLALHAEAAEWFHRHLMKSPAAQIARDYLKSRGLTPEVAARWKIGYAPEAWENCLNWAAERGYNREVAVQGGLAKWSNDDEDTPPLRRAARDRFRHRLMFPISNDLGEVIAFSGRVLVADKKAPKYVNSPETPIFTKGKVLFGLNKAKRAMLEAKFAIVCEGQIDMITAFEAGVHNVTASQGTAFTHQQAVLLKRQAEEVVLCFDADSAGQKAAEGSLAALLEANVSVRVATMPPGEDPDSLIRTQGAEAFKAQIAAAKDFFDFQIDRLSTVFDLNTPRGKTQFSKRMADSVALLTDNVLREAVVGKVSARLGMAANDFRALLRKPRPGENARRSAVDLLAGATPETNDAGEESAVAFEKPPVSLTNLLKLALEHAEARQWLHDQAWEELLPRVAGGELLSTILAVELDVNDPSATAAFLATLPPAEETFLSGLLMDKSFPQPLLVLRDSWRGLERALLLERLAALESRMRLPDVASEEITRLQKEVLDLQLRLKDIARL